MSTATAHSGNGPAHRSRDADRLGSRLRGLKRLGVSACVLFSVIIATACEAPVDQYAALGDSYTSGIGIVDVAGQPTGCFRSSRNYPNKVAERLQAEGITFSILLDLSCNGATTANLHQPQDVFGEQNPAQIVAVQERTKVVTLGIGLNDLRFVDIMALCFTQRPPDGCKARFTDGTNDLLRNRISVLEPKIGLAIDEIRTRAPNAVIIVVGYPTIVPGDGICASLDLAIDDLVYLSGVFTDLNGALRLQAETHGAVFVDTATSSIGHDVCAGSDAWINPPGSTLADPPDGTALHPNSLGVASMSRLVAQAVETALVDSLSSTD